MEVLSIAASLHIGEPKRLLRILAFVCIRI